MIQRHVWRDVRRVDKRFSNEKLLIYWLNNKTKGPASLIHLTWYTIFFIEKNINGKVEDDIEKVVYTMDSSISVQVARNTNETSRIIFQEETIHTLKPRTILAGVGRKYTRAYSARTVYFCSRVWSTRKHVPLRITQVCNFVRVAARIFRDLARFYVRKPLENFETPSNRSSPTRVTYSEEK